MVGRKFRKEKNEIRYHRVDLGNEDESFHCCEKTFVKECLREKDCEESCKRKFVKMRKIVNF